MGMPKTKYLSLVLAGSAGLVVFAALLGLASATSAGTLLAVNDVVAVLYTTAPTPGLDEPVDIANTGLLTDTRLFVVERDGRIKVVTTTNGVTGAVLATPFLSITHLVDSATDVEMGMLGMAFSPNYASNGQFFVYYNNNDGDINVARYTVSANPNVANVAATIILTIPHPTANNHNGGDLAFGPDGFLYMAPGDGGNTPENAQDVNSLLGKVLRLNVTGQVTYTIPVTNPFVGEAGRDEIWALGLRNPYRFSFDRLTGDMYIGDVGQGDWEEVDYQPAGVGGLNYGWRCYEGNHNRNIGGCVVTGGTHTPPVAEYCNTNANGCVDGGQAVIGGHVYRGAAYPGLYGYYIYADAYSDNFRALKAGTTQVTELNINNLSSPSGFGENVSGELFVADRSGNRIYRIQGNLVTPVQTPHWLPIIRR
jgi:glucose/arabinose dehydrogenase